MKALVVYDTVYGNTERIAKAIAGALGNTPDVTLLRAGNAKPEQVNGMELVVVGSPTQGFQALPAVRTFLDSLPTDALKGIQVAAFDTRMGGKEAGAGVRFITKLGGYAAKRIADALKKKGGNEIAPPDGFFVTGREGPLAQGEIERAAAWAKGIAEAQKADPGKK